VKTYSGSFARRLSLAALLVALTACSGDGEAAPTQQGRQGGPGGRGAPRIAVVETEAVQAGSIARDVNVSGVVEPIRSIGVNSQVAGALLSVTVEEGTQVRQGQILARLDDREIAAQERSAQAEFAVRQAAYERARHLREGQVITLTEYERDRAAYAAARAQLEQLRTRRGYAVIRAPAHGVVTEKRVEAGDVVGAQTRLFTIGDLSTMVVRVSVSELDVVSIAPGHRVRVALDAFPGREVTGTVRRIFPAADPTTRLVPVEVALGPESRDVARPGFLARVTLALGAKENVLLVPTSAVVGANGGSAVFVVQDGAASRRTVSTGLTSRGQVEIVSGLTAGEAVVITGNNALRDGAEVRVVSGPGAGPPPERAAEGARGGAAAPGGAQQRRGS
jgi:membrane fusion protein, multidrug efflux system